MTALAAALAGFVTSVGTCLTGGEKGGATNFPRLKLGVCQSTCSVFHR